MQRFNRQWIFFVIILTLGVFLRAYHWQNYSFGFDQIQILENVAHIRSGHPVLIGPRTGPAPMFTGPLIYYTSAIWSFVAPEPYYLVFNTLFFAILSGTSLYFLVRKLSSKSTALSVLMLWAGSPFLIFMDRIPWNPNLTILASALAFFPLLTLTQKSVVSKKYELGLLALLFIGCFLGYQAHFSGLLLPVAAIAITALLAPRRLFKVSLASLAGLAATLLPTLVFDLRNQWLNLNGMLVFLNRSSSRSSYDYLNNVRIIFGSVTANIGDMLIGSAQHLLLVYIGSLLLLAALAAWRFSSERKNYRPLLISLLWIVVTAGAFLFYNGEKPEYYYLLQVPAVLFLISILIEQVSSSFRIRVVAGLAFATYAVLLTKQRYPLENGINMGTTLKVVAQVRELAALYPKINVAYDMKNVYALGMQYLLKDLPLSQDGQLIHLQYVLSGGDVTTYRYGDLGIWIDPRTNPNLHYLNGLGYIVGTPKTIDLFSANYPNTNPFEIPGQHFVVLRSGVKSNELWVLDQGTGDQVYRNLIKQVEDIKILGTPWTYIENTLFHGWAQEKNGRLFLLSEANQKNSATVELLSELEIIP